MNSDDKALFCIAVLTVGLGAVIALHTLREHARRKLSQSTNSQFID